MSSAFCWFCRRDEISGELFCARIGKWCRKCPFTYGNEQDECKGEIVDGF